jgi:hypothetical protein
MGGKAGDGLISDIIPEFSWRILYSYTVNATILFDNHTTYFDHKGSSSGVTIYAHVYQTSTLTFTSTYMYLSSDYDFSDGITI